MPRRIAIERILCPTDFSEFSERALRRAVLLGRHFGARVSVLHVIPWTRAAWMAGDGFAIPASADVAAEERREAQSRLESFIAPHLDSGVPIETRLGEGEPCRVIEAAANEMPADLVVMGTHGRGGWDRLVLGSTTERVIRRTLAPVLTVGQDDAAGEEALFPHILCALDLTPGSHRTLGFALSLAEEKLARLTLVHVVEASTPGRVPRLHAYLSDSGLPTSDILDAVGQELERHGDARHRFCEVNVRVETGTAWREILKAATEIGADLIVMGAHTTGGFGPTFLGSTADQIVRHASCPVLIARELKTPRQQAGRLDRRRAGARTPPVQA